MISVVLIINVKITIVFFSKIDFRYGKYSLLLIFRLNVGTKIFQFLIEQMAALQQSIQNQTRKVKNFMKNSIFNFLFSFCCCWISISFCVF